MLKIFKRPKHREDSSDFGPNRSRRRKVKFEKFSNEQNKQKVFQKFLEKYSKGFSKHFIPARISENKYKECLHLALKIHKIFNCNTLSRIDFIFDKKQEKIYFLEINSQPGMTKLSLLPEQAEYQNIDFENIILNLINNAR